MALHEHVMEDVSGDHSFVRLFALGEHLVDHDPKTPHIGFSVVSVLCKCLGGSPFDREPDSFPCCMKVVHASLLTRIEQLQKQDPKEF